MDILESSGPVGIDILKGEQCLGYGGALQGWKHFLINFFFTFNHGLVGLFCLPYSLDRGV